MNNDNAWKGFLAVQLPIILAVAILSGWSGAVYFNLPNQIEVESIQPNCTPD